MRTEQFKRKGSAKFSSSSFSIWDVNSPYNTGSSLQRIATGWRTFQIMIRRRSVASISPRSIYWRYVSCGLSSVQERRRPISKLSRKATNLAGGTPVQKGTETWKILSCIYGVYLYHIAVARSVSGYFHSVIAMKEEKYKISFWKMSRWLEFRFLN